MTTWLVYKSGNTMVTLIVTKLINLVLAKIINVDFIDWWCPRTDSNRGPIDYKSILKVLNIKLLKSFGLLIFWKGTNSLFFKQNTLYPNEHT